MATKIKSNKAKQAAAKQNGKAPAKQSSKAAAPAAPAAPNNAAFAKLLADPKQSEAHAFRHEREQYGKPAGAEIGRTIQHAHVIAKPLNAVGVGGSFSMAKLEAYAVANGVSLAKCRSWMAEQSTVSVYHKIPKYRIVGDTITVLRLHINRAGNRATGAMKIVAPKKK